MRRGIAIGVAAALAGCGSGGSAPTVKNPNEATLARLGTLMKNEINPAFSKLVFLTFHADEQEDPGAVRAELQRAASDLQAAFGLLREWGQPPVQTDQGREVFFTYASAVDGYAGRLVDSIVKNDTAATAKQLEQIAGTCNNCHHFFRLDVEDSVIPSK